MGSLGSVNVLSHQGYRDCYPTGSLEDPHLGMLPPSLGEAMRHRPDFVQLTTWNDYTEGTMLEPSWLRAPWLFHVGILFTRHQLQYSVFGCAVNSIAVGLLVQWLGSYCLQDLADQPLGV